MDVTNPTARRLLAEVGLDPDKFAAELTQAVAEEDALSGALDAYLAMPAHPVGDISPEVRRIIETDAFRAGWAAKAAS